MIDPEDDVDNDFAHHAAESDEENDTFVLTYKEQGYFVPAHVSQGQNNIYPNVSYRDMLLKAAIKEEQKEEGAPVSVSLTTKTLSFTEMKALARIKKEKLRLEEASTTAMSCRMDDGDHGPVDFEFANYAAAKTLAIKSVDNIHRKRLTLNGTVRMEEKRQAAMAQKNPNGYVQHPGVAPGRALQAALEKKKRARSGSPPGDLHNNNYTPRGSRRKKQSNNGH